jgi:hypothetical protein
MSGTAALSEALERAYASGEMTAWWEALTALKVLEDARKVPTFPSGPMAHGHPNEERHEAHRRCHPGGRRRAFISDRRSA